MAIPAPLGVAASGQPVVGDQATAVLTGTILGVGPTKPFAFRGPMNLLLWASINATLTTTLGSLTATVGVGAGLAAGVAVNSTLVPPGTTYGAFSGTSGTLALPVVTQPGQVSTFAAAINGLAFTSGLLGATVVSPRLPAGTKVVAITTPAVAPTGTSPGTPGVVQISALPLTAPNVAPGNNTPVDFFEFALTANGILASGTDAQATFTGAAITFSGTIQLERSFDGGRTWIVCNIGAGALAQFTAGTPVSITFGEPERQMLYRLNCTAYSSGTINYRVSQTGGANESLAIGPLSSG